MSRIVILTEGHTNPSDAKTATGVIRYRGEEVVAVLDSTCAGRRAADLLGVGGEIPIVASLGEVTADTLLIGIAPAGGRLPGAWREVIKEAIRRRLDIVSGLHVFLSDDEELAPLAREAGVRILDVRRPPQGLTVARNAARQAPCFRVHTVGHDCGVGKLVVAAELARAFKAAGRRAELVATGQTGIMIAGRGVAVDAVVSDFVAGAIEAEVLALQDREFLFIEGQGSLVHPLFSGVTLGLLHGCAPQAMVMCYDPTRREIRHAGMLVPPLEEVIEIFERLASIVCPSRVVAVAANTFRLSRAEAEAEVRRAEERLGLPATDVIRFGPEPIVEPVLEAARAARPGG